MIVKAILLGLLTATSYQPKPEQTKPSCRNRFQCTTSINDGITMFGVAVSQDLLKSGKVNYGDTLYIEGYGRRVVNDCMGETKCVKKVDGKCVKRVRILNSVDLMVFTHEEEKRFGTRKLKVWVEKGAPMPTPGLLGGLLD